MKNIKIAFKNYVSEYGKNLPFIPRISYGAIHEVNQTHCFCVELAKTFTNAFLSFEIPIENKDGNKKFIDGLVISKDLKKIFYIESKRLTNGSSIRRGYIYADIQKVLDADRQMLLEEVFKKNANEVEEYIVVLADLWIDQKAQNRNEIPYWWCGEKNQEKVTKSIKGIDKFATPGRYFIDDNITKEIGWSSDNQFIDKPLNNGNFKDYYLLLGFCKLTK